MVLNSQMFLYLYQTQTYIDILDIQYISLFHLLMSDNLCVYIPAIKAEPLDDYNLNSYGYADSQSLTGISLKSLYHHLEQDNNLQTFNVHPSLYHLATVDPRACMLTSDQLEDQPVYYQSKAGTLINSPVLYHTANQRYSNSGTTLLGGSPKASHLVSTPNQCVSARTPVGKLSEGPQVGDSFEACLVSRHQSFVQTSLPLGKSPPSRYIQSQAQVKAGCRVEPGRGNHEERTPERVMVKQENLSYAYLEDGEYYCYKLFSQMCTSVCFKRNAGQIVEQCLDPLCLSLCQSGARRNTKASFSCCNLSSCSHWLLQEIPAQYTYSTVYKGHGVHNSQSLFSNVYMISHDPLINESLCSMFESVIFCMFTTV